MLRPPLKDVDSRTETMSRGLELVSLQVLEDRMPGNEQKWASSTSYSGEPGSPSRRAERRGTSYYWPCSDQSESLAEQLRPS